MRLQSGKGKAILRDMLFRNVPRNLVKRPKQGFAMPLNNWLRGELKAWADLLNLARLDQLAVTEL